MRRALGQGTPQPWPPEWDRWVIKAERTADLKLLKQAHGAIATLIERDSTATLNGSLNTHAADQTRSRPRRLHCVLAAARMDPLWRGQLGPKRRRSMAASAGPG